MKRFIELEEEIMKILFEIYNKNAYKPIAEFRELYVMEDFMEKSHKHLAIMKEIENYVRQVRVFVETMCDQDESYKLVMLDELKEIKEKVEKIKMNEFNV